MLSVQAASQGAGQMRPVNSGKLLVECSTAKALLPVLPVHQVVEVRNDVVDRAAAVAERRAAVHAARGLHLGLLVVQAEDEFLVVLEALVDRACSPPRCARYSMKPVIFPIVLFLGSFAGSCWLAGAVLRRGGVACGSRPTCALLPVLARSTCGRASRPGRACTRWGNTLTNLPRDTWPSCPAARGRACCRSSGGGPRAACAGWPRRSALAAASAVPGVDAGGSCSAERAAPSRATPSTVLQRVANWPSSS